MSGARLLAESADGGVMVSICGDAPDALELDAPSGVLTEERLACIRDHKTELLTILRAEKNVHDDAATSPPYTAAERRLMSKVPNPLRATVDIIKTTFADTGGVTVLDVRRDRTWSRRQAARLIRDARRVGDHGRAVALRDAWRERVAICEIDGGLVLADAERVAFEEVRRELNSGGPDSEVSQ